MLKNKKGLVLTMKIPRHIKKFIRKIEQTHRGLGVPIFIQYIALAGKVSTLWIGVQGAGKSTIIESIKLPSIFAEWLDVPLYQVTKTKLTELLGRQVNKTIFLRLTELAHIKGYQRELFIDLVGTLVTSKNFDYTLTKKQRLRLINCDLVVTAGIQPITFMKMTLGNEDWSQFARDRFVKLLLINPLRETSIKKHPNVDPEVLFEKYNPEPLDWAVKKSKIKLVVDLLNEQCSIWRSLEYAYQLAKALTRIFGLKRINHDIIRLLYNILYPYVYPFNKLNIRPSLEVPKHIWGAGLELFSFLGNYFGKRALYGVPVNDLAKELGVRRRTVMLTLKKFEELQTPEEEDDEAVDLIRSEIRAVRTKKNVTHKRFVYLAPKFKRFFFEVYPRLAGRRPKK